MRFLERYNLLLCHSIVCKAFFLLPVCSTVKPAPVGSLRTRQNSLTYTKSELRKESPNLLRACMGPSTSGKSATPDDVINTINHLALKHLLY